MSNPIIGTYLSKENMGEDHPFFSFIESKVVKPEFNFWISRHHLVGDQMIFINAPVDLHTEIKKSQFIDNYPIADFESDKLKPYSLPKKWIRVKYQFSLAQIADTDNEKSLNKLLQLFYPGHVPIKFNSIPKPSGTFTEDFNETNGTELADMAGWTLAVGDRVLEVLNNKLAADSGATTHSYYTCTDQGSANHYIEIDGEHVACAVLFVACRLVDVGNCIYFRQYGTGAAGSRTGSWKSASASDDITFQGTGGMTIKLECDGTAFRVFKDSVQQGSDQTDTDHNTETSQGFIQRSYYGATELYDNFEAGPMAAGPAQKSVAGNHGRFAAALSKKLMAKRTVQGAI